MLPRPQPRPEAAPAPAPPAVTVTLSPEARAAQAALAAMPMADAVKQLTPGAQSGPLAQIKSLLLKLADGSGVPKEEQLQAYIDVHKRCCSIPTRPGTPTAAADDRKALAAILNGGAISTEIRKAADDFNHFGMSQDIHSNVPRKNLAHLNAMSPLEQQMVFAGTMGWEMDLAGPVEDPDAGRHRPCRQDDRPGRGREDGQKVRQGGVRDQGRGQGRRGRDDGGERGLAGGPGPVPPSPLPTGATSVAAAALKMLQKAAEARAKAKNRADQDRKDAEADARVGAFEPTTGPAPSSSPM